MPIISIDEWKKQQGGEPSGGGGSIYDPIIAEASEKYGVPEEIIRGVAKFESGGKQEATSPKGARGVMQIMPGTAVGLAKELGVKPEQVLNDAYFNIHGGTKYLAQMYNQFGDWPHALAAYNAGPGRVGKYLAGKVGLPAETSKYVDDIMGWLGGTAPAKVAKGAISTLGSTLGKYMEGAQAHEYAHTPITDIEDVKLVKPGTMVEQTTPDFDMRSEGLYDDLLYGAGGFLGMIPDLAFQTALAYGGLGPLAGSASPLAQIATRLGVPAGGFAGMTAAEPGSTPQDVGVAAATGAALGGLSPLSRLLRMPLAGALGYGHAAYQHPEAPTHSKLASALLYAGLSGIHGKQPLYARTPKVAGEPEVTVQSETWPPGGRPAEDLPPDLDVPPWMRGGGRPEAPPPGGGGARLADLQAAAERDPFAAIDVAPDILPGTDFNVGPYGEVLPAGVEPGVPALRQVPTPKSHEVPVEFQDVYPPAGPSASQPLVTPDVVTPIEGAKKPKAVTKAGKTAPPVETAQPTEFTEHPAMTPEVRSLNTRLEEIDSMLVPGLETVNPGAFAQLTGERAYIIGKARALMERNLEETLSPQDQTIRAAAERARAKPKAEAPAKEAAPTGEPYDVLADIEDFQGKVEYLRSVKRQALKREDFHTARMTDQIVDYLTAGREDLAKVRFGQLAERIEASDIASLPHPLSPAAKKVLWEIVEMRRQQAELPTRDYRGSKRIEKDIEGLQERLDKIAEVQAKRKAKTPKPKAPPPGKPSYMKAQPPELTPTRMEQLGPEARTEAYETLEGPTPEQALPKLPVTEAPVEAAPEKVPPHQGPGMYRGPRFKPGDTEEAVIDHVLATKEKLPEKVKPGQKTGVPPAPIMEQWKTEAPPPVRRPLLKGEVVRGADEPSTPVRVASIDLPSGYREEYFILPPTEENPQWTLTKDIVNLAKDRLENTGPVAYGKSARDIRVSMLDNPELARSGIKRMNEPVQWEDLRQFEIRRTTPEWEHREESPETAALRAELEGYGEEEGVPDFDRDPTMEELQALEQDEIFNIIGEEPMVEPTRRADWTGAEPGSGAARVQAQFDIDAAASEATRPSFWKSVRQFFEKASIKDPKQTLSNGQPITLSLREWFTDISARAADILNKAGEAGQWAEQQMRCAAGAGREAMDVLNKVVPKILSGLGKEDVTLLNGINKARRIIFIDSYKGEGKVKHPGDINGRQCQEWLDTVQRQVGPEKWRLLSERSDLYNQHMLGLLTEMRKRGVIGMDEYNRMMKPDVFYSPRKFLQFVEGSTYRFRLGGRDHVISASGLKALSEGSINALEHDSMLLLAEYTNRAYAKMHRNRANLALHRVATEVPQEGIARELRPKQKPNRNEEIFIVKKGVGEQLEDGSYQKVRTVRLAVSKDVAHGWILGDPQIGEATAWLFQTLSGTKLLKAAATGYNPAFGVANLPRDIMTIFWSTFEYSGNPIRFAYQMAKDLGATWRDAYFKTGRTEAYIKEGGGMNFLSTQGKMHQYAGRWKTVADWLGAVGETTELWGRLALRERALRNGRSAQEATYIARTYLDFHQGGTVTKALDNFCPYLNASMQGARAIGRAAVKHPWKTLWKVAQIGTISAGLYAANVLNNPEAMKQIPFEVKNNYWCFPMPWETAFTDQYGRKKVSVLKIPKDQFSRAVGAIFEGAMASALGIEESPEKLNAALWDFLPWLGNNLPPTAKAFFGYRGNYDYWRGRNLWKGAKVQPEEEYYTGRFGRDPTHPLAVAWGKLTGMSPVKTKYAAEQLFTSTNPFVLIPMEAFREALGGKADPGREMDMREFISRVPVLNKFITTTSPYAEYGDKIARYAEDTNTRKLLQNRGVDELSEVYYNNPTREDRAVVMRYIREQDVKDRKDLIKRFKFNGQVFNLDDREWWLQTYSLPAEAKAQAFMDRYQKQDSEGQQQMIKDARRLKGYAGAKFFHYFRKLDKPKAFTSGG